MCFLTVSCARWIVAAPGVTNEFYAEDQLRTTNNSRATIQFQDGTTLPVNQMALLHFKQREGGAGIRLLKGIVAFFHRDRPRRYEIEAGGMNMVIRGTEFAVEVRDDETAVLTLFDGEVDLSRRAGPTYPFSSGDVVTLRPGEPPPARPPR